MFKLAMKSLMGRKRIMLLIFISLSLSVLLFLGVQRGSEISRNSFSRTISGTDLIVGARTAELNLLLSTVFLRGNVNNNISYARYEEIRDREEVAWAIPISLGDNHNGFKVVGTNPNYFEYFRYANDEPLKFAEGEAFSGSPFQAVIGYEVAKALAYHVNQEIVLGHGSGKVSLHKHDDMPFTVVGVLERTGTAVDNIVLVPEEGISAIHIGWENGMKTHGVSQKAALNYDLKPKSIAGVYVGLHDRRAVLSLRREINAFEDEPMTALLPGMALFELWSIMGPIEKMLSWIAGFVVLIGLLSLLTAQMAVLDQRRREMALLRSIGASPGDLFKLLFIESLLLSVAGCISAIILLYGMQWVLQPLLRSNGLAITWGFLSPRELLFVGITLVLAIINGLIPAIVAYRSSLHDGISVRN